MRRLRLLPLLVGAGVLVAGLPAAAAPAPLPTGSTRVGGVPQVRALQLLTEAARAARTRTYTGTQYVSTWHDGGATAEVADVRHTPGSAAIVSVHPTAGQSSDLADSAVVLASDLDLRLLALLTEHYALLPAADTTVVGRPAHVVEALRSDGGVAGRFWLDAATGLVLRRESFDAHGRLVRSSAFTTLRIGAEDPAAADAAVPVLDRAEVARLQAAGWQIPGELSGDLELFDARLRVHQGQQVLHLSYSDGLSTLSLFAQHGRLGSAPLPGFARQQMAGSTVWVRAASPERVVWGGGGRVFTLLSDASPEAVRSAVRSLPHDRPPRTGLLARLERGLKRLGSWLNPFD